MNPFPSAPETPATMPDVQQNALDSAVNALFVNERDPLDEHRAFLRIFNADDAGGPARKAFWAEQEDINALIKAGHEPNILVVDADFLKNQCGLSHGIWVFNQEELAKFLDASRGFCYFGRRHELEKNKRMRQWLPYPLVLDHENKLVGFVRLKGSGENKLHGNVGIGWGGHPELSNAVVGEFNNSLDVQATLAYSEIVELSEELAVEIPDVKATGDFSSLLDQGDIVQNQYTLLIIDDSDEVGLHHVGLVNIYKVTRPANFAAPEAEVLEILEKRYSVEELLSSDLPIENWTRMIAEMLVKHPTLLPV